MPKFGEGVRRQPNSGLEGLKHERPLYAAKAVRRFSLLAIFVLFATASGCSDRGDPSGASPARSDPVPLQVAQGAARARFADDKRGSVESVDCFFDGDVDATRCTRRVRGDMRRLPGPT
jgi:hypothetical protein